MIETVILTEDEIYPFGQITSSRKVIKVQDIKAYSSIQQLRNSKLKMQKIFSFNDKYSQTTASSQQNHNFIKLLKIYQSQLNLHFIYEYIPYSLHQYIETKLYNLQKVDFEKSHILEMNSKLFLKKVCYQLGTVINYLIKAHIKTNLEYQQFGIDEEENLKYFLNSSCQLLGIKSTNKEDSSSSMSSAQIKSELKQFYQWKKQEILNKLEIEFNRLKKKDQYVPNFVIKGNQLIFCQSPPFRSESQSECCSPIPSIFTESSFTQRCQSLNNQRVNNDLNSPNIRRTHGNLMNKLKKAQSYNYNTESNKKLQQNINKLQMLRKKNKKLNDEVYQSYLSTSQNIRQRQVQKQSQKQSPNRFSTSQGSNNLFHKKLHKNDQPWRNSQIPSNLHKTHMPSGASQSKSPNRFGLNFQDKRSKSNRNHKSSFQFKGQPRQTKQWFNPNKSFDKSYEQQPQKSFHQTKSIRIQLQQTTKRNKQRKNSYKVKILTCQQMQLDGDNIEQFVFNAMNKNFGNEQKNEGQSQVNQSQQGQDEFQDQSQDMSNEADFEYGSTRSKKSKYSSDCNFENIFSSNPGQKGIKYPVSKQTDLTSKYSQSPVKQHIRQKQRQSSSQKNIFEKYYQQFGKEQQKSSKNQKLQEKIKLAKQKAENVLNKYMKAKKLNGSKKGL